MVKDFALTLSAFVQSFSLLTIIWPRQEPPSDAAWASWNLALEHLATNDKLYTPLGPWINIPHQQWRWFTDRNTGVVHLKGDQNTWFSHQPVPSPVLTRRITRQLKTWFTVTSPK